jgi:hypothetical protein
MSRIVLHIDRLVLRGIAPAEIEAFTAALRQELQSQLATPGMAETLSNVGHQARMKAGEVHSPKSSSEGLGQTVARRIMDGLHPGHDI